ncbi:molybdopterin biosynthesis protein [Candidatus Pyrohabitans sp.]
MELKEFHDVVSIAEARRRLKEHLSLEHGVEEVPLDSALGRVLARDIVAQVDVPPFDRASMDGYAVVARDTFYADEESPVELLLQGYIRAGDDAQHEVMPGTCVGIATGAAMPRGANAVVMVEYTEQVERNGGRYVRIYKPVAPGENVMAAGADIMRGEVVLREGTKLTPREIGVLAALGMRSVEVVRRPRVAIISTGDEILPPGEELSFGKIYDVNAYALAQAVRECGGEPVHLGIVGDSAEELRAKLEKALSCCDVVITSGGTSAGVGDLSYRVIDELGEPGILVHGVAIKPGKPMIIGVARGKPVFGLPGYPTSAMVTFDVFVAPLLRSLARLEAPERKRIRAKTAMKFYSAGGRYEYKLVNLVRGSDGSYSAYPVLTGSGAITTLAEADGYIEIPENVEMLGENEEHEVVLLSEGIRPADLTIIGSHCIGVDLLVSLMSRERPIKAKIINVGSSGGLRAVRRGESDISGTHLIDEATGEYNLPFIHRLGLADKAYLVRGYNREQGFVVAKGNPKGISGVADLLREEVRFINRNPGSGTRVLFDLELKKLAEERGVGVKELAREIRGYEIEAKSHSAIAAAVAYGRADVGLAIRTVAEQYDLDFIPLREEKYDFAVPGEKFSKREVKRFIDTLASKEFRRLLEDTPGLAPDRETGRVIYEPG